MSYKAPKVTVTQNFDLSAADVAVESLPSAVAASAFYVGDKENIGAMDGVGDDLILYPHDDTIYSVAAWPREMYEFYPIIVNVKGENGNVDITGDISVMDNGIEFDEFESYELTSSEAPVSAKALLFKIVNLGVQVGEILAPDATVVVLDTPMSDSEMENIKPGMPVGLRVNSSNTWGVEDYVESVVDSTHIKLQAPAAVASYDGVIVGSYQVVQKWDDATLTSTTAPCVLYDIEANFSADGIAEGDILTFTSPQNPAGADVLIEASVVQVLASNMLVFNTITQGLGRTDYDKKTVKRFDQSVSSGMSVTSYSVKRLISLSENRGYKDIVGGVQIDSVSGGGLSFTIDVTDIIAASSTGTPTEGDVVAFTTLIVDAGDRLAEDTLLRKYFIQSIVKNVNDWTIVLNQPGETSVDVTPIPIEAGHFVTMWKPVITHDILLNYRAWNPTEAGVVQRIAGVEKIKELYTNGEDVADENELAFMARAEHLSAAGGVIYVVNVDPKDPVTNYGAANEALKRKDVYSHAYGTTDPGVNALIPSYVNAMSDPEKGKERIATLVYSAWDVYLKRVGVSSAVSSEGVVTITETIPLPVGVRKGDKIYLINQTTNEIESEGILTSTPSAVATTLNTDITDFTSASNLDYRIHSTDPNDQAIQVGALSLGNRRVKQIWPGWFTAQGSTNDFKSFPPFYISATRAGMDSGFIASQAFTNFPYSIPGLKNISLETNEGLFDDDMLDIMGGGGIDIQIQETSVSQVVKSRHDLSSDMTSIETQSWSITKQVDVAAKTYRKAVAPYVGSHNIEPKFLQFLGEICGIASSAIKKAKIVRGASTASVTQDPDVVDKINITVSISIFIAGNRIDITLNVKSR